MCVVKTSVKVRHIITVTNWLQMVAAVSVFFIVISIVSFCLKTHPPLRIPNIRHVNVTTADGRLLSILTKRKTEPHQAFFYVECVCNAWFTFEFIVRLVVSPSKLDFFRGLLNVIDMVATVSFYLDVLLNVLDMDNEVCTSIQCNH